MANARSTTAGASPRPSPRPAQPPLAFSTASWPAPLRWAVELLSSVWFGIWLLILLFIYSSLGSAGVIYPVRVDGALRFVHAMPRQWRAFEMTEFEWFHTTAFLLLCLLLAANITIVTVRKIPFNLVKLGVWMIHAGIVILIGGSLLYFGTKFEGDAPVIRAEIIASVQGVEGHARLAPFPGDTATLNTPQGPWRFTVAQISPLMELNQTDAQGHSLTAYSAFVSVQGPDGTRFARRVVKNHPDRDEDLIEGRGLVRNLPGFNGNRFADDRVSLTMRPVPQHQLWLKDSHAIYYRELGDSAWTMAPIKALPRYNDYLPQQNLVWPSAATEGLRLDPISVPVRLPQPIDAIPAGTAMRVIGHIRYGGFQDRLVESDPAAPLNPTINIALREPSGAITRRQLAAFDPNLNTASLGLLRFAWVNSDEELNALRSAARTILTIEHPETSQSITITDEQITNDQQQTIPGTEWRFRVRSVFRGLMFTEGQPPVSVAIVDFQPPEGEPFTRWVFEDASRNIDTPANPPPDFDPLADDRTIDPRITTTFNAGGMWRTMIVAGSVAGPDSVSLRLLDRGQGNTITETSLSLNTAAPLKDGASIAVESLITRGRLETRPVIVPASQRDADIDRTRGAALILLEVTLPDGATQQHWLPYNQYVADDDLYERVRIASNRTVTIPMPDGRAVEVCYGRQRQAMPAEVQLDDFRLRTHVGGFTGNTLEIRDWHSLVRFRDRDRDGAQWSDLYDISTNDPSHYRGHWFFQSYWDAPRPARSASEMPRPGFSFTGLGIGNREGVWTMLFGSTLSVLGIIYAFYIKPIIKRRREAAVYAQLAGQRAQLTDQQLAEVDPSLAEPNLILADDATSPGPKENA